MQGELLHKYRKSTENIINFLFHSGKYTVKAKREEGRKPLFTIISVNISVNGNHLP
jgi:hypothetical protein